MYSFALFEIVLSLWLLSGKKIIIPALLAAGMMLSIIIFNLSAFNVLFRNVAILCAALSLASMHWNPKKAQSEKEIQAYPPSTHSAVEPTPALSK
jgi:hypothetical protein